MRVSLRTLDILANTGCESAWYALYGYRGKGYNVLSDDPRVAGWHVRYKRNTGQPYFVYALS